MTRELSFQHDSSFIGKVTYTPEINTMEIQIGKQTYGFFNVPQRIYDSFEASPSVGQYFARNIKGQYGEISK